MLDCGWSCIQYALTAYFTVRILKFLYIILKSICVHLLTPIYSLDHLTDMWTVISGGTDGIGRAYIEELAKERGIRKFYLIGRNAQKLENVKQHLEKTYSAVVKTAVFNFESSDYTTLPSDLSEIDVGILVNCAGIAPTKVGNFIENDKGLASKIFQVNLISHIKILELCLPGMLKRDKGVVVNVSSMTGWRPLPYLSSYPASKAALSFFSDSLYDEFSSTNVKIQCLIPMLVATKVASYEESEANNIFVVTPENYAKQAVRAIGRCCITTGCFQHDVQIALGTLLSFSIFKFFYVPLVMLGIHKKRVAAYQENQIKKMKQK